MKKSNLATARFLFVVLLIVLAASKGNCQNALPDILSNGTIKEQMDYIIDRTKIFNDYRAIREDMFQKLSNNAVDSIKIMSGKVTMLQNINTTRGRSIDSLNSALESARADLNRASQIKNSIRFAGLEINKTVYNVITLALIIILVFLLVLGFLILKRNQAVTRHTRKEYEDLRKEFDAYRKAAREAREKMSMAHFNEVRKLRGV